jgi:hypothetical protein
VNQRLILHPATETRDQFLPDARANIDVAMAPGVALEARQRFGEITRGIKMNLQSFVCIEASQHQTYIRLQIQKCLVIAGRQIRKLRGIAFR